MESASRADRNMPMPGSSADGEGSASMHTARKPQTSSVQSQKGEREVSSRQRSHALTNIIIFAFVFAAYAWFVRSLEGLDGDTTFLALFCTALTMFVCKAFFGMRQEY